MNIEGSSISCGVRRLVLSPKERTPTLKELQAALDGVKNGCAMITAGVPARRKDVVSLLIDVGFQKVQDPSKLIVVVKDSSINNGCVDINSLVRHHGNGPQEEVDDFYKTEQFIVETIDTKLGDMAFLMMQHGVELNESLNFFVYYTAPEKH